MDVDYDTDVGDREMVRSEDDERDADNESLSEDDCPTQASHVHPSIAGDHHMHSENDAIDARILELKHQGFECQYIVERLQAEHNRSWSIPTAAKRCRILLAEQAERDDEELDAVMSDWHQGEDDDLEKCVADAQEEFERQVRLLRKRKWRAVSKQLEAHTQRRKYSAKACEARYLACRDGVALPPIELDPDPELRKALRQERNAAAKECLRVRRQAEEVEKLQQAREARQAQQAKEQARLEKIRIQELKKGTASVKEVQRKRARAARDHEQSLAAWHKKVRSTEESILLRLRAKMQDRSDAPDDVTKETLGNPRSIMSLEELDAIICERRLKPRQRDEDHAQIVARLAATDNALSSKDVHNLLKEKFVLATKADGKGKDAKLRRLQQDDAMKSRLSQQGVTSLDVAFKSTYAAYDTYGISRT